MKKDETMLSRFDDEWYQQVLSEPIEMRSFIQDKKDKYIWSIWVRPRQILFLILFFFTVFMWLFPVFLLFVNLMPIKTVTIISITSVLVSMALPICRLLYIRFVRKRTIRVREKMSLEKFIADAPKLNKFHSDMVSAVRESIGFVYGVSPEIIYPNDKPDFLSRFSTWLGQEPYAFEVIIRVSRHLGLNMQDNEVDEIIETIHQSKSANVGQLACVICNEMKEWQGA